MHFCKCPAVCPRSILHTSDNICKSTPILQMQGPCLFRTFSYTRHICVIDTNYLNSLPTRVLIYFYGTSISDVVPVKVKDIFIHKTCIIAGGIRGICVIDTNYWASTTFRFYHMRTSLPRVARKGGTLTLTSDSSSIQIKPKPRTHHPDPAAVDCMLHL